MNLPIINLIFASFALTLIAASVMVIVSREPVRSALFLVLAFFASAGLWMLLEAEFLSLVLVLVYVGAVMTLFLFVVMTLNTDELRQKQRYLLRSTLLGFLVLVLLVGTVAYVLGPHHSPALHNLVPVVQNVDYDNTKALGMVLYSNYLLPFEMAGILLLVAIIAAISLSWRVDRNRKTQRPELQVKVKASDRIKIIKMAAEPKQ